MTRIIGVDIPSEKRIDIALTYLYGVGRSSVAEVLEKAGVDPAKRAHQLSGDEIAQITKALEKVKTEGDLREERTKNIKRLKRIGSYRGLRHSQGLPVRGQRTKSNARTKRGKRVTIGALKKEALVKLEQAQKAKEREAKK
jgi:small subunit ribosomal protein S13